MLHRVIEIGPNLLSSFQQGHFPSSFQLNHCFSNKATVLVTFNKTIATFVGWGGSVVGFGAFRTDTFYSSLKTLLFSRARVGSASE